MSIFLKSPQCHFEFHKLSKIVETKGLFLFWNVKMRWIKHVTTFEMGWERVQTLIFKIEANNGFCGAN